MKHELGDVTPRPLLATWICNVGEGASCSYSSLAIPSLYAARFANGDGVYPVCISPSRVHPNRSSCYLRLPPCRVRSLRRQLSCAPRPRALPRGIVPVTMPAHRSTTVMISSSSTLPASARSATSMSSNAGGRTAKKVQSFQKRIGRESGRRSNVRGMCLECHTQCRCQVIARDSAESVTGTGPSRRRACEWVRQPCPRLPHNWALSRPVSPTRNNHPRTGNAPPLPPMWQQVQGQTHS